MPRETLVLPGERCRQAREELRMSLEDASKRMHLSMSYLKALEADDYERLPEAAFVKGYLRNYAKLLGLPADDVANTFQQLVNESRREAVKPAQAVAPTRDWRKPVLAALAVLLLLLLLLWVFSRTGGESQQDDLTQAATPSPTVGVEPAPREQHDADQGATSVTPVTEADEAPPVVTQELIDDSAAAPVEPVETVEQPELSDADVANAADPEPLADSEDELVLRFSDACWLRILDAQGGSLFEGQQGRGDTLTVRGERPFQVVIGNPPAVSAAELNGEPLTLPSVAPGSVLRTRLP